MKVQVACSCGRLYSVEGELLGKPVKCNACGAVFTATPATATSAPSSAVATRPGTNQIEDGGGGMPLWIWAVVGIGLSVSFGVLVLLFFLPGTTPATPAVVENAPPLPPSQPAAEAEPSTELAPPDESKVAAPVPVVTPATSTKPPISAFQGHWHGENLELEIVSNRCRILSRSPDGNLLLPNGEQTIPIEDTPAQWQINFNELQIGLEVNEENQELALTHPAFGLKGMRFSRPVVYAHNPEADAADLKLLQGNWRAAAVWWAGGNTEARAIDGGPLTINEREFRRKVFSANGDLVDFIATIERIDSAMRPKEIDLVVGKGTAAEEVYHLVYIVDELRFQFFMQEPGVPVPKDPWYLGRTGPCSYEYPGNPYQYVHAR